MNKRWIAAGILPLAALAISAGPALGGGAISKQKAPTTAQKKAILKAAKMTGPANCYTVQLAARQQTVAGLKFNAKAGSSCNKYAFDGAAVYYGNEAKTQWFLFESGSSETAAACDAMKLLMGAVAWQDMIPYIGDMGCYNFD